METHPDRPNELLPSKKAEFKDVIKIVPEKYIVFQCQDDEPMGEVRINAFSNRNLEFPPLRFEIMCTNKENYKVSNPQGLLKNENTAALIRIYIKNIDNLQKCLADKFRIRIINAQTGKEVIPPVKLKILIEKHKPMPKFEEITNLTHTVSRTTSNYMAPSIYNSPSLLSSTAVSDLRSVAYFSRLLTNESKKVTPIEEAVQTLADLKEEYEHSAENLNVKEKQLKCVVDTVQKNKAKQKVCLASVVLVFLIAVTFGFVVKKLAGSSFMESTLDFVQSKI